MGNTKLSKAKSSALLALEEQAAACSQSMVHAMHQRAPDAARESGMLKLFMAAAAAGH